MSYLLNPESSYHTDFIVPERYPSMQRVMNQTDAGLPERMVA